MTTRLAVALILALAGRVAGESIQKWKTTDGSLYFGDKPPRGSVKVGEYDESPSGDDEASMPAGNQAANDRFSVEASLKRKKIERSLNAKAEQLAATRSHLAELGATNIFGSDKLATALFGAEGAKFHGGKGQLRQKLQADERAALLSLRSLFSELDELDRQVRKAYTETPPWWRQVTCAKCPSPAAIQEELDRNEE